MLCRQIQASFCLSRDLAGGTVSIFINLPAGKSGRYARDFRKTRDTLRVPAIHSYRKKAVLLNPPDYSIHYHNVPSEMPYPKVTLRIPYFYIRSVHWYASSCSSLILINNFLNLQVPRFFSEPRIAFFTPGCSRFPSKSTKKRYSQLFPSTGRDSIFVMFRSL